MYGDTAVMRKHAAALRDQGADIRAMADHLVGQAEQIGWAGRAAAAMRERVRERAAHLRGCASSHEGAADALEQHLHDVERSKDAIAEVERKAGSLVADAQTRVARVDAYDDPEGVERRASDEDRALAAFTPPPSGHRDWLTIDLPGH
ncbi:MAG: hypothetical protein ACRDO4_09990 [Nocardioides sp.]